MALVDGGGLVATLFFTLTARSVLRNVEMEAEGPK